MSLAVTKGFGADAIDAAVAAGCRRIGENYAQELIDKLRQRDESGPMPEIHFIGRLQSNKVRSLTGVVDVYESVDRPSLVAAIAKQVTRCAGARAGRHDGRTWQGRLPVGRGGEPRHRRR